MSETKAARVPIATIAVGERDRDDMGDLEALAASIEAVGLLHPVVVTESMTLVAGDRRLAAVKQLGWTDVPVTVVDLTNAADVLRAEADENTERKPLTPYEASRARERRAQVLAEDATRRRAAHGGTAPGRKKIDVGEQNTSANLAEVSDRTQSKKRAPASARETRKAAAAGSGYSGSSLDKVDEIVHAAEHGKVAVGRGKQRREVDAPPPVREEAQRQLASLKKTSFAVEPASKAFRRALDEYVPPDPDEAAARYAKDFIDALSQVRKVYSEFEPEKVATVIDMATAEQLERHAQGMRQFSDKVTRARSGLRLIRGGAG